MLPIELVLFAHGADIVPEGRNRQMLCPYHDDKVRSASVDTERGVFICFTCGVQGDAIALIMQKEGLGFRDAQRRAAEIAGDRDGDVRGGAAREPGSFLPGRQGDRRDRRAYRPSWLRRDPS